MIRHLDASRIRIKTTYQSVHELCYKDTVQEAKAFWASFNAFISSNSNFVLHRKKPVFNNQEVDLYRLYRTVEKRGGYGVISERKAWREIAQALQIEDKGNNAGSTLKQWYLKYLQPFKEYSVSRNTSGAGMLCDAVESAIYGRVVGLKTRGRDGGNVEVGEEGVGEMEEMGREDDMEVVAGMLDLIPNDEKDEEAGETEEGGKATSSKDDKTPRDDVKEEGTKKDETGIATTAATNENNNGSRAQRVRRKEGSAAAKKKEKRDEEEEGEEEEEDPEDAAVSAMVCEACRGGHYEDQVRRVV